MKAVIFGPIHLYGEAEAPILWPPDVMNLLIGKDPDVGED